MIPRDNPPITDGMTQNAVGTSSHDLVGETIVTAYDIPDSDESTLLLCESGRVLLIFTDMGYNDDDTRNSTRWDVCFADATDTEAGRAIVDLEPGQWL